VRHRRAASAERDAGRRGGVARGSCSAKARDAGAGAGDGAERPSRGRWRSWRSGAGAYLDTFLEEVGQVDHGPLVAREEGEQAAGSPAQPLEAEEGEDLARVDEALFTEVAGEQVVVERRAVLRHSGLVGDEVGADEGARGGALP
jgi:hypothetical protein